MKKTHRLRGLIEGEGILVMPGVHDCLSAKIAEKIGFKGVFLGGYAISAKVLSKPDIGLLTITGMVNHTRNIIESVEGRYSRMAIQDTGASLTSCVLSRILSAQESAACLGR
jgi:methylisocitrate lyase